MSHYEERLEADLAKIRQRIEAVGTRVLAAQKDAVHALLTGNRALAYDTILGDLAVNREIRSIDRACHAFVARHLPTAGHLRFVSSVLRLNVEIERIGDYAVTICREAVQLSAPPSSTVARDIELMADQSRAVLKQALKAWNEANAELARGTLGMAKQAVGAFDKVFADLLREGQDDGRRLKDLFALLGIFNRFRRVAGQAKNICEETIFAVAGETKPPKIYRVLFVDERNDCASQLAEAYARKAFPGSGRYDSAGWRPGPELDPRCRRFMERHGLDAGALRPAILELIHEELASFHVVVSLGGDPRPYLPDVPFHTVVLEWPVEAGLDGLDDGEAERRLEEMYRRIAARVQGLMEALRGEGAS